MSYTGSGFAGERSKKIYMMALMQQQQAAAKEAAAKEAAAKEAAARAAAARVASPPMQEMGPYQEAFTPAETGGALPVIILAVVVLAVIGGGTFFLYKKLKGEKDEEEWEWEEEEEEPEMQAAPEIQAAAPEIAPKLPAPRRRRR
jgi:hypothetical protein